MTDEELDRATGLHAMRELRPEWINGEWDGLALEVAARAARLAREGWTPPPRVDPDVLAVRELLAARVEVEGNHAAAGRYRSGGWDAWPSFINALTALRLGRQLERDKLSGAPSHD